MAYSVESRMGRECGWGENVRKCGGDACISDVILLRVQVTRRDTRRKKKVSEKALELENPTLRFYIITASNTSLQLYPRNTLLHCALPTFLLQNPITVTNSFSAP